MDIEIHLTDTDLKPDYKGGSPYLQLFEESGNVKKQFVKPKNIFRLTPIS